MKITKSIRTSFNLKKIFKEKLVIYLNTFNEIVKEPVVIIYDKFFINSS